MCGCMRGLTVSEMAQLASPSGLAVLRLRPAQTQAASLLLCMAPGALRTSLVAHYASGVLVGCAAQPTCLRKLF